MTLYYYFGINFEIVFDNFTKLHRCCWIFSTTIPLPILENSLPAVRRQRVESCLRSFPWSKHESGVTASAKLRGFFIKPIDDLIRRHSAFGQSRQFWKEDWSGRLHVRVVRLTKRMIHLTERSPVRRAGADHIDPAIRDQAVLRQRIMEREPSVNFLPALSILPQDKTEMRNDAILPAHFDRLKKRMTGSCWRSKPFLSVGTNVEAIYPESLQNFRPLSLENPIGVRSKG